MQKVVPELGIQNKFRMCCVFCDQWCRAGRCVPRGTPSSGALASLGPVHGGWSEWSAFSDCASGCLLDDGHPRGSTGLMVSTRRCNNPRPENGGRPCEGSDRRYRTCSAPQVSPSFTRTLPIPKVAFFFLKYFCRALVDSSSFKGDTLKFLE